MMSKAIFDKLPKDAAGHHPGRRRRDWKPFAREGRAGRRYGEVGQGLCRRPAPRSATSTRRRVKKWRAIARDTAWKDYADKNETCAGILKAAQKLL